MYPPFATRPRSTRVVVRGVFHAMRLAMRAGHTLLADSREGYMVLFCTHCPAEHAFTAHGARAAHDGSLFRPCPIRRKDVA